MKEWVCRCLAVECASKSSDKHYIALRLRLYVRIVNTLSTGCMKFMPMSVRMARTSTSGTREAGCWVLRQARIDSRLGARLAPIAISSVRASTSRRPGATIRSSGATSSSRVAAAFNDIGSFIQVDSRAADVGTCVKPERDLGLTSSHTTADILARVRLSDRWIIEGEYFKAVWEETKRIEREISSADHTFDEGADYCRGLQSLPRKNAFRIGS